MTVRLRAGVRRDQILDVTRTLAGNHGLHAVTIDGVARAAGISRPVVYEHFGSLEGLLHSLLLRERARALGQLQAVLPQGVRRDPIDLFDDAFRAYLVAVREDPGTWKLVLTSPEGAPGPLQEQLVSGRDELLAPLVDLVLASPLGRESPDPELSGQLVAAIAGESARRLLTDPERYPIKRTIAHARWALGLLRAPAA